MNDYSPNALSMLTEFFTSDTIEQTARRTGFVRRKSKMTGKVFLALVTFGLWSNAKTTLSQLPQKGGGSVIIKRCRLKRFING
jgi:hypothetical protein